jgi:hypothetical protein
MYSMNNCITSAQMQCCDFLDLAKGMEDGGGVEVDGRGSGQMIMANT